MKEKLDSVQQDLKAWEEIPEDIKKEMSDAATTWEDIRKMLRKKGSIPGANPGPVISAPAEPGGPPTTEESKTESEESAAPPETSEGDKECKPCPPKPKFKAKRRRLKRDAVTVPRSEHNMFTHFP